MQHWYAEVFFFALMVFVAAAIVAQYGWRKLLSHDNRHIILGCGLLTTAAGLDIALVALVGGRFHTATADALLLVLGFVPGLVLLAVGVLRWIKLTAALTDEIARRKEAEKTLLRMTARLETAVNEAASATRDKSDFLSNMSHELRTPLNAIIGFSELMNAELYGKLGAPEYRDYVSIIHDSGRHLLGIVGDLLDLNEIQSGQMTLREESIELEGVVRQCMSIKQQMADQKSARIKVAVEPGLMLCGDVRLIRQTVLSLLGNALSQIADGGAVTIAVSRTAAGQASLTIEDNGNGMTAAEIARIAAPFGQGNSYISRSDERAALNLSLVNAFVELHGGRLMIDARQGEGTQVTVSFPRERVSASGIDNCGTARLRPSEPSEPDERSAIRAGRRSLSGASA